MRMVVLLLPLLVLCSCAPSSNNEDLPQTKYPETPTMQSAEDAATGKLW
jgi:hypothetical protein